MHEENYRIDDMIQINDIIKRSSILYPDSVAIRYRGNSVTYHEMYSDVLKCQKYLLTIGVSENEKIALYGENSYEWIIIYFAIVGIGAVVVPMDTLLPYEVICELINDYKIERIILSGKYENKVAYEGQCIAGKILASDIFIKSQDYELDGSVPSVLHDDTKICQISFTSGTTGKMKAVKLSAKNIMSDLINTTHIIKPDGNDTILTILPFYHMLSLVASVLIPITYGFEIMICDDKKHFVQDYLMFRPKWLVLVPAIVVSLYKMLNSAIIEKGISVSELGLKHVICGGAKLSAKYEDIFSELGIELICGYGITECSPVISINRHGAMVRESCGIPLECCKVMINAPDDNGNGEIWVSGDNVFSGYIDEFDTAESFCDGWFKTGDIGRFDDEGNLFITGRLKKLIILDDGNNVAAEELENLILENIPDIHEVVVYEKDGRITAELYTLYDNKESIYSSLKELNYQLPFYKRIQNVVWRETTFPKTSTLKIKIEGK